jgi:cold shock CspA family protein
MFRGPTTTEAMTMTETVTGALAPGQARQGRCLKWCDRYGFIRVDHADRDVFVHQRQLLDQVAELVPGQRVSFVVARDRDGRLFADQVAVLPRHARATSAGRAVEMSTREDA